jgi:hypothetical protein
MPRPPVSPTGAQQTPRSGRKPSRAAASNVRPLSRRGAKRAAQAAIRDLAERALVLEPRQPGASRYALAYLASLSPRHLLNPPTSPADLAKLADSQADMLVGVIRAVLDGLGLSDAQWERGSEIASDALRACTVPGWEP